MSSTYSLWLIPLCLSAGFAYAFILYGIGKGFAYPMRVRRALFLLRTLAVSLLGFLLLRPVVAGRVKEVEKPVLIFGIDNSESLVLTGDSAFYRDGYLKQLSHITERLSRDYQVETYLFGDSVRHGDAADYLDKGTDLSGFFTQMEGRYANRNVGAMVCLTDGIYTEGENPLHTARRLPYPIYTVALGDTTCIHDLRIAKIRCNKSVYKNNFFPMEILVRADRLKGKSSKLQVTEGGKTVFEKEISVNRNDYSEWVRLNLEAASSGRLHYRITLTPVEGEHTGANNVGDVLVKVIEDRYRVAVVYRAPHPDVAALSEAMKDNPMYLLETFPVEKFNPDGKNYDLYVLHQLPSSSRPVSGILESVRKSGAGLLLFPGDMSDGTVQLPAGCGLKISKEKGLKNDAYPEVNPDFSDFTLSNDLIRMLPDFTPLQLPFGTYSLSASASVFLYQKINNISTRYPLCCLNDGENGKMALFLGEGWWRWRIHNYLLDGNHRAFDHMVGQVFQYLTTKEDRSFFRVRCKDVYGENEEIRFDAEVYNKNYELTNQPEVRMHVMSESDGSGHDYIFSRVQQAYHLDLGRLPEGEYRWTAEVGWQGGTIRRNGWFYVQPIRTEALDLTANHHLLLNISAVGNGRMIRKDSMSALESILRADERIKPVAKYTRRLHPLVDQAGILMLLFILLGGEWFLRKWSGNY